MGTDSSIPNNPYYYEPPDASYNMSYGNQMGYSVGQHAPSARGKFSLSQLVFNPIIFFRVPFQA